MTKYWSERQILKLSENLTAVLLEEWGGPRSPMALDYIQDTIIPDLVFCFRTNDDLLTNPTFAEIIAWKLKNQFAYPFTIVNDLAKDLLRTVRRSIKRSQNPDPSEPWRRIFRLWVCEESLPNIAERSGYPLEYLDLLLYRLKKLRAFLAGNRASLLECRQQAELKEFGPELLGFLYRFQTAFTGEPMFAERLVLEQVIIDMRVKLEVPELVALLETIHAHEGQLSERDLAGVFSELGDCRDRTSVPEESHGDVPTRICELTEGLIALHYLQRNKAGKLSLSEKSARTIAPFLLPKLSRQIQAVVEAGDLGQAEEILLSLNPEVLVNVCEWVVKEMPPDQAYDLIQRVFKKVNRRIDLYLLSLLARFEPAFGFLLACLNDKDSLVRAKACEGLGRLGNKEAVFRLIQLLDDPVPGVREMASKSLGDIGALAAVKDLARIAQDYGENTAVRKQAREALRKIEGRHQHNFKATEN